MKRIITFCLCVLLLLSVGCGEKEPSRVVEGSIEFTAETLPKICVTAYTNTAAVSAVSAVLGIERDEAQKLLTVCDTTDDCYTKLINGECDIVLAPTYGLNVANELKDMPLPIVETVLNTDALVFVTNGKSGVESLTAEQIKSLYMGEITDWKEFELEKCPVTLFGCAKGTAARGTFERFFGTEMSEPLVNKTVLTSKGEFATEISYDNRDGAIGYSLLSVVSANSGSAVKPLSVDGVAPTKENIASNKYIYKTSILAAMRGGEDENSKSAVLYRWLTGEQGKQILGF